MKFRFNHFEANYTLITASERNWRVESIFPFLHNYEKNVYVKRVNLQSTKEPSQVLFVTKDQYLLRFCHASAAIIYLTRRQIKHSHVDTMHSFRHVRYIISNARRLKVFDVSSKRSHRPPFLMSSRILTKI